MSVTIADLREIDRRLWPNGFAGKDGRRLPSPLPRFISKIEIGLDGCWYWKGTVTQNGYGLFCAMGVYRSAHRWICELVHGPAPSGFVTDHLCRHRNCVNPDHLEWVTQSVNVRRGDSIQVSIARNKSKTSCPYGHPYEGHNLLIVGGNGRACRECARRRNAEYRMRRRAA